MFWPLVGSRTFLVGCVAVIAAFEVVAARRTCNTARYGQQNGREVHVQDQHLSANNPDWRITVPPVCNRIVGVSVTACDVDGAPSVYLSSLTRGMVMRTGRFSSGAFLYVTAFCDPNEEVVYEENLPRPPPRFKRPPNPSVNRWNEYQKPIAAEDIIIMSPSPTWPKVSTEYTTTWQEEPVVLGINSYSVPESFPISNSYPIANLNLLSQAYRSKDTDNDTTTEIPQNVTASNNSTEVEVEVETTPEVQPERSRTSVEELKPETWITQQMEPAKENGEPTSADPDKPTHPLSFLRHLALWWLKHVRSWAGLRSRRRMWRRRGSRDNRRMFRRRYNHPMSHIPRYS